MNALVITPMQEELDYLLQHWTACGLEARQSVVGRLPVAQFAELGITIARGGTGKAQFALQTQHLLDCGRWDLAVCAGGAGALVDHLWVGDVIVATTTVEHDYINRFNDRPVPRFDGWGAAISELRCVAAASNALTVHFGIVASGDEDIAEPGRRDILRQAIGALAVAWEGAGGARACCFSDVPFVEIRGITDTANEEAPSDFETNLKTAMTNVGHLIAAWIGARRQPPT